MKLSKFTSIFTVALILLFSLLSVLFALSSAGYLAGFLGVPTIAVYIAGALFCLPAVAVLFIALPLSGAVKNDTVFTQRTAKTLALISYIMIADCTAFLIAVSVLALKGEFLLSPLFGMTGVIGIAVGVLLRVLSDYIKRAAILKEEADATL